MTDRSLAASQLGRMRGMTRFYHERFFSDIRFSIIGVVGLLVIGWWEVPEAFLLVPVVALIGAVATAFDASYLIFARQYAARLERRLDPDGSTLVAARLEERYLFPLDRRKIVTVRPGADFTWFGFVTLFYTVLGIAAGGFGLALALPVLRDHGGAWVAAYVGTLVGLTVAAIAVGIWWFVAGEGERRLRDVLDEHFGAA